MVSPVRNVDFAEIEAAARRKVHGDGKRNDPSANRMAAMSVVPPTSSPVLIRAVDVEAVNVTWLWSGRLPFGKLTCLDGDPGLGKSTILYDVAARYSAGLPFPDVVTPEGGAGVVLVCTAEDGYADTVRPRLEAAGADLANVHFFDGVKVEGQDFQRPPTFPADIREMEEAITDTGARLVIVDPLFAFLGGETNTWNDANMRQALAPLQALAERLGVALVVIRHWTKGSKQAIYRGGGSIGISGAARSVLLVAPDPDYKGDSDNPNDHRRVLAVVKANLAAMAPSLAYRLEQATVPGKSGPVATSRVQWLGTSTHRADSLAMAVVEQDGSAVDDARVWLLDALEHGPRNPLDLRKGAEQAGHSWASIRRAKDAEGIEAFRQGFGAEGKWLWRLPSAHKDARCVDAQTRPYSSSVSTFEEVEHLRPVPTTYKREKEGGITKMLNTKNIDPDPDTAMRDALRDGA